MMNFGKMLLKIVFNVVYMFLLFALSNLLMGLVNMIKTALGDHVGQFIGALIFFTIFMFVVCRKIFRDTDLRRDITALLNKSEGKFSKSKSLIHVILKEGWKEILCFMIPLFILYLLYLTINPDPLMHNNSYDVFERTYDIFKFIYSKNAVLGTYNNHMVWNYIFTIVMFTIPYTFVISHIISECEKNRLHRNSIS